MFSGHRFEVPETITLILEPGIWWVLFLCVPLMPETYLFCLHFGSTKILLIAPVPYYYSVCDRIRFLSSVYHKISGWKVTQAWYFENWIMSAFLLGRFQISRAPCIWHIYWPTFNCGDYFRPLYRCSICRIVVYVFLLYTVFLQTLTK